MFKRQPLGFLKRKEDIWHEFSCFPASIIQCFLSSPIFPLVLFSMAEDKASSLPFRAGFSFFFSRLITHNLKENGWCGEIRFDRKYITNLTGLFHTVLSYPLFLTYQWTWFSQITIFLCFKLILLSSSYQIVVPILTNCAWNLHDFIKYRQRKMEIQPLGSHRLLSMSHTDLILFDYMSWGSRASIKKLSIILPSSSSKEM